MIPEEVKEQIKQITTDAEKLEIIKQMIETDQKFSLKALRLVKEIRRVQKGKSLLYEDDRKRFANKLV